jgi:hypothetical protein
VPFPAPAGGEVAAPLVGTIGGDPPAPAGVVPPEEPPSRVALGAVEVVDDDRIAIGHRERRRGRQHRREQRCEEQQRRREGGGATGRGRAGRHADLLDGSSRLVDVAFCGGGGSGCGHADAIRHRVGDDPPTQVEGFRPVLVPQRWAGALSWRRGDGTRRSTCALASSGSPSTSEATAGRGRPAGLLVSLSVSRFTVLAPPTCAGPMGRCTLRAWERSQDGGKAPSPTSGAVRSRTSGGAANLGALPCSLSRDSMLDVEVVVNVDVGRPVPPLASEGTSTVNHPRWRATSMSCAAPTISGQTHGRGSR